MTIENTVQQSLSAAGYGSYSSYAQPVVTALVDREHRIVAQIVEFAREQGLAEDDARGILRQIGMEVPVLVQATPAPAPAPFGTPMSEDTPADDAGIEQILARISNDLAALTSNVSGLTEFARRNGYSG